MSMAAVKFGGVAERIGAGLPFGDRRLVEDA